MLFSALIASMTAALDRAIKLDAQNAKALFFVGLAAVQDGRMPRASWRRILETAAPTDPIANAARHRLFEIGSK